MQIIVDTNIIIDFLRSSSKEETIFYQIFEQGKNQPMISFITVIELYAGDGMVNEKERIAVEKIIGSCGILEGHMVFYQKVGELLRRKIGTVQDLIIASTSIIYRLPLLTRNEKHFKNIQGVVLYKIK